VAYFATAKLDAEGIAQHYKQDPKLVAENPGLPYGMSREQYLNNRAETEGDYAQMFGTEGDVAAAKAQGTKATAEKGGAASAEPDWLKTVFKQGISADQAHATFADYFKRLGRAPSADEIAAFRTKHKETFA